MGQIYQINETSGLTAFGRSRPHSLGGDQRRQAVLSSSFSSWEFMTYLTTTDQLPQCLLTFLSFHPQNQDQESPLRLHLTAGESMPQVS